MNATREESITPEDLLREYMRGRRNFGGVDLLPDGSTTLENVRLDGTDFQGAFLDASFAGSSLRGATFVNANVKACVFDRTDLTDASFVGALIDAATFFRANLTRTDFSRATSHSHIFQHGELPPGAPPEVCARHERFVQALESSSPADRLLQLAHELRDEGEHQPDVLGLFELYRRDHAADADESRLDTILDVIDYIAGWCSPERDVYSSSRTKSR